MEIADKDIDRTNNGEQKYFIKSELCRRLFGAFERSAIPLLILDQAGTILFASPESAVHFNTPVSMLIGLQYEKLVSGPYFSFPEEFGSENMFSDTSPFLSTDPVLFKEICGQKVFTHEILPFTFEGDDIFFAVVITRDEAEKETLELRILSLQTRFKTLINNMRDAVYCIIDQKPAKVLLVSKRLSEWTGFTEKELRKTPFLWYDCISGKGGSQQKKLKRINNTNGETVKYQLVHNVTGESRTIMEMQRTFTVPGEDHRNILFILRDITKVERQSREILQSKNNLKKFEAVVQSVVEGPQEQYRTTQKNIKQLFDERVFPHLSSLHKLNPSGEHKTLLHIIEENISEILSSVYQEPVQDGDTYFTPMQQRVLDLIQHGKTSEEIADLLGISSRTVRFHRSNLRKKLGIANEKVNLYTFLKSRI